MSALNLPLLCDAGSKPLRIINIMTALMRINMIEQLSYISSDNYADVDKTTISCLSEIAESLTNSVWKL